MEQGYEQTAEQKHQEYLAAVQQYMDDTKPENILVDGVESHPLLGPEIRHIVDYERNPSPRNLRRMLAGLAGPVRETAKGIVKNTQFQALSDEFDLEVVFNWPTPAMKGNPWAKASCTDEEEKCYCQPEETGEL